MKKGVLLLLDDVSVAESEPTRAEIDVSNQRIRRNTLKEEKVTATYHWRRQPQAIVDGRHRWCESNESTQYGSEYSHINVQNIKMPSIT